MQVDKEKLKKMPTFLDLMMYNRGHDRVFENRMLLLLAQALTHTYKTDREKVLALNQWTKINVVKGAFSQGYPTGVYTGGYLMKAEELVRRGFAICGGISEVFATMAWLAGYPARRVSIFSSNQIAGHATVEVLLEGKWSIIDPTFDEVYPCDDGSLAGAADLHKSPELVARSTARKGLELYYSAFDIMETVWSVDGFHGMRFRYTPETEKFLYGMTKNKQLLELLETKQITHYYTAFNPLMEYMDAITEI